MSSPSRQVIDPLICSYSEQAERRPKMSLSSSGTSSHAPTSKFASTQQNNPSSSWTPLVSRTFNNESLNSTPSSKLFNSLCKQNGLGGSGGFPADSEFAGLNLTPFLTHNMNLLANPNSAGNLSVNGNFTPFYDKSMHMADFFMDSPIRPSPGKLDVITPSRFNLSDEPKTNENRLNPALSVKKSVSSHPTKRPSTQIDTPARRPSRKSGKSGTPGVKFEREFDYEHDENDDSAHGAGKKFDDSQFVTPSKKKVLREMSASALNKTPMKATIPDKSTFLTPAAKCPVSSPSTVIMSSAVKSPVALSEAKNTHPPTPTPHKDVQSGAEPVMGIFSEKKAAGTESTDPANAKKSSKKSGGVNKFQIVFTDVHTLMNSKKKKSSETSKPERRLERKKSKSKVKGQGQLQGNPQNQLQGHSQSQSQSQGLPHGSLHAHSFSQYSDHNSSHNFASQTSPQYGSQGGPSFNNGMHGTPSFSITQDFNTSMSSTKEFSMINNSTLNTTHGANLTGADHASFDLIHGGLISTPNAKFLLDNSFEKQSPLVQNMSGVRFSNIHGDGSEKPDQLQQSLHEELSLHREYMPPPKSFTLQQAAQAALRHEKSRSGSFHQQEHVQNTHQSHQPQQQLSQHQLSQHQQQHQQQLSHQQHLSQQFQFSQQQLQQQQQQLQQAPSMAMNMSMSTPQHDSVMQAGLNAFTNDETSPSAKNSMRYLYQQLHQYQPVKSSHESSAPGFSVANTSETLPEKNTAVSTKNAKRKTKKR